MKTDNTSNIKKLFKDRFINLEEDLSSIDLQITEATIMISAKKSEIERIENEIKLEEAITTKKTEKENMTSKFKKINALWNKSTIIFEMMIEIQKNRNDLLRLKHQYRTEQDKLTSLIAKYEMDELKTKNIDIDIESAASRLLAVIGDVKHPSSMSNVDKMNKEFQLDDELEDLNKNNIYKMD